MILSGISKSSASIASLVVKYHSSFKQILRYPASEIQVITNCVYGSAITFPNDVIEPHACTSLRLLSASTNNWTRSLEDKLLLSQLSIPGTHDSGSYLCKKDQFIGINKTQSKNIYDQLCLGIRFLDLRVKWSGKEVKMYRNKFQFENLSIAVQQISQFLKDHPQQFIIANIQGYQGPDFSQAIQSQFKNHHVDLFLSKQSKSEKIPTVGQIRGKVWMIGGARATFKGFTLMHHATFGFQRTSDVYVQNYYLMSCAHDGDDVGFAQKWNKVTEAMEAKVENTVMKINFLDGCVSNEIIVKKGIEKYFPYNIAMSKQGPNYLLYHSLLRKSQSKLGIIVMDFPGQDIISQIIKTNPVSSK